MNWWRDYCCDPRLVVVPWLVIGCPKAGRRTLDNPSASDDQPMTGHRTAQTSIRRPSALTNQILFPAEAWLPKKIACEKEHLETWRIMLCVKYDFVIIADYFCTKTFFDMKISYRLNNWKLSSNRQRTQWRCNKFQLTNIFAAPWTTIVVRVILAKVYLCWVDHLNTLHTHTLCMFYFITDGYQNSIFCNIASIPSRDYEKSHRLKQRELIGQPSLRTAVSQACPSGRIHGWYDRRLVATYNYSSHWVQWSKENFCCSLKHHDIFQGIETHLHLMEKWPLTF